MRPLREELHYSYHITSSTQRIGLNMLPIEENLKKIKSLIKEYAVYYNRDPNTIQLLAVSKHQPVEKIKSALVAGQKLFGENYLQEALDKQAILNNKAIEWHFIGHIQRNKTKKIAEHFSWVHSVSSKIIAERLNEQRPQLLDPLNICIEVNTSHETTKSGLAPNEVLDLANFCKQLPHLKLRGLMCIPEPTHDFEQQRTHFRLLATIYQELKKLGFSLDTLSMGMSDDFKAAIAEGSTIVRVGTAIFGQRTSNTT